MRYCLYCKADKPFDPAAKPKTKQASFYGNRCWDCYTQLTKLATRTHRQNPLNAEANRVAGSLWAQCNPDKASAKTSLYRSNKIRRIPAWANLEVIKTIYAEAAKQGLTVDHVIPLRGKLVSGLHVENNLQLLTKQANSSKNNSFRIE